MINPSNFFGFPVRPTMPAPSNQINPDQFRSVAGQLNPTLLSQLANQARQQGISEQDIQAGLNFINQMK